MAVKDHWGMEAERVQCAIVTVSDTRTEETDETGPYIQRRVERVGHEVVSTKILPDDRETVSAHIKELCNRPDLQVIILTGGTGLAKRDNTYEAVSELLDKRLDGFGELFRMLSYQDIGPAAMLSRAVGGVRGKVAIFALPGSRAAVRLGVEKLILPQLGHVAALLSD